MSLSDPTTPAKLKLALIGNPNSGKTTLFNLLTGLNQKTGNFAGVTVDKKTGQFVEKGVQVSITDLPGTYSVYPKTLDEQIACKVLTEKNNPEYPDVVLYVADATNLKRSLYLLTQIIDLGLPVVLAVNMTDLLRKENLKIDFAQLSSKLQIPVVPVSAINEEGIAVLKQLIVSRKHRNTDEPFYQLSQVQAEFMRSKGVDSFSYKEWYYFQKEAATRYGLTTAEQEDFRALQSEEIVYRYKRIDYILEFILLRNPIASVIRTNKIDDIITHPFWGYLIFVGIMFIIFQTVFNLSSYPMDFIEWVFAEIGNYVGNKLPAGLFSDLLVNGLLAGLSGILVFIPQIAFLFAFISVLEDSGYMARVSLLSDRILRVFGLNGKSVISLLSGMACAVPAIMGTRTINNITERLITIMITPLMSCSARLPVYTLLIAVCIPQHKYFGVIGLQGLVMLALYLLGFILALVIAFVLSRFIKNRETSTFIMEMPVYRTPKPATVLLSIIEKVKVFVLDAGKIILAISILLWGLSTFGPSEKFNEIEKRYTDPVYLKSQLLSPEQAELKMKSEKLECSYAGILGHAIEPAIKPLGYDWKIGIALITSFAAREVFVGTMATLYSVGDEENTSTLREKIAAEVDPVTGEKVFTLASGLSLMVFYLFAMQCVSTIAVVYRETKSIKWPLVQFFYMSVLAYVSSFIIFQVLK